MATMAASFFGDLPRGRIGRAGFAWRLAGLLAIFLALAIGLGLTGGIESRAVLFFAVSMVLCFAMLNIFAKRFRDLGLNGWVAVAVAVSAGVILSLAVPGPFEILYVFTLILALGLLPGRAGCDDQ